MSGVKLSKRKAEALDQQSMPPMLAEAVRPDLKLPRQSQVGRVTFTSRCARKDISRRMRRHMKDPYYRNAKLGGGVFDIAPGDPLVQMTLPSECMQGGRGEDTFLTTACVALNGAEVPENTPYYKMMEMMRPIGFAQGPIVYDGAMPSEDVVAVSAGGANTVFHNGTENIMCGDELMALPPGRFPLTDVNYPGESREGTHYVSAPSRPADQIPAFILVPYKAEIHGIGSTAIMQLANSSEPLPFLDREKKDGHGPLSELFDRIVRVAALGVAVQSSNEVGANGARAKKLVADIEFRKSIFNALFDNDNVATAAPLKDPLFSNLYSEMMVTAAKKINMYASKRICKATSNAAPGGNVDILQGVYRF